MALEVGQTLLGKYKIERVLGEGGFGCVYQATDNLQRPVAIKELRAELANDANALRRFQNEAIAIAKLNNPHIVTVWGMEPDGPHHYIVLEFMDGGSLANLLTQRGKLTPSEAAMIARAVCDGLAAAHQLGIVHRDIKPANILLSRDGKAIKISDFGIAHVPASVSNVTNVTRLGTAMGTPWYMSPEQARGQKVDARSDLYSVGVMLYEMVAGYMYLDFTSDFLSDLEKLKTDPPRPLPSNVPPGLQQIITRALAKDPAQRYQSAEEMSAALQAFITPGATIAIPTTPSHKPVRAPASAPSRSPLVLVGAAVLGLLAIAVIGLFAAGVFRSEPSSRLALAPTGTGVAVNVSLQATPSDAQTEIARVIFATQTAQAEATRVMESTVAARVAATLTAAAPTATRTATPTLTPTETPRPTATPTVTPTPPPSPTRGLVGIQLINPPNGTAFRTENPWITLEWRPNPPSFKILADNEYYRVQVYASGRVICNFYTKDTVWTLPPSGESGSGQPGEGCDPGAWRFNTMQLTNWRVSLVVRVDQDRNHDIEKSHSEGWSFKWFK